MVGEVCRNVFYGETWCYTEKEMPKVVGMDDDDNNDDGGDDNDKVAGAPSDV